LSNLKEDDDDTGVRAAPELILEFKICKHKFHESCLDALHKQGHNQASDNYLA
jgi:hypothetical protein